MSSKNPPDRRIYRGLTIDAESAPTEAEQLSRRELMPDPPPWRDFTKSGDSARGEGFVPPSRVVEIVNAALCLRRPILVEGEPGSGKTTLAYAVARELGLPGPYRWSVTSRTTLKDGLYSYDAIGRLQEASLQRQKAGEGGKYVEPDIGKYLRLGPLGMAFYASKRHRPAVLLVDEIDKSDIDLPNDLLHIFEEGSYEIPELSRLDSNEESILPHRLRGDSREDRVTIERGFVAAEEFPLVLLTSNEEREFPPAFLRRCLRLRMGQPDDVDGFYRIVANRLGDLGDYETKARELIGDYLGRIQKKQATLATDQLLNAVHLLTQGADLTDTDRALLDALWESLRPTGE